MNPKYERELEAEIARELKGLPQLPAPRMLASRVMLAIEGRASVAWYRQPWQRWPVALRIGSLTILLALFGGLCFAAGRLAQGAVFVGAAHNLGQWLSNISALGNAVSVLLGAVTLAVKQLGTAFIVAALLAVAAGYAMCLGLGTVCVRLALARR
jgi:ABC-type amino acid transport system permease subunit